jgi:DNA-binding NarL/FixJ family response regulator
VVAKIRVVIADDHTLLREAMRNLLNSQRDIEVVGEAGDGETAVRLCSELKPDMAILDIVMPKLSGVQACEQIKRASLTTAVLILTAYDDDAYVIGLLEAGAAGYLLKSVSGNDLVSAIRTVQAGESVLHPTIIAKLLKRAMRVGTEVNKPSAKDDLSERELEVLKLAAKGLTNKDIAEELYITVRTVKAHLSSTFNKTGAASRTEAIVKGLKEGWLSLEEVPQSSDK